MVIGGGERVEGEESIRVRVGVRVMVMGKNTIKINCLFLKDTCPACSKEEHEAITFLEPATKILPPLSAG